MLLIRAELSYFRQYGKKTEIFFPKYGMIGILGVNGAGKSTLFNAIQWAFYGKIKDVTSAMIKNQKAGKKDKTYVETDFVYQGKYYRVHRDLVSSRCYVQVDGMTRAMGTTAVNQFIEEEVFKMDHKTFCTCYYAEQDDFDALVKLNPGPRVQMLTKMVRIESIDQAIELNRKEKRQLESKIVESRKRLQNADEYDQQKTEIENEILKLKTQISICDTEIKIHDEAYKNLAVQRAEADGLYRRFTTYASYIQKEETEKNNLERLVIQPSEQKLTELMTQKERFDLILPQVEHLPDLKAKKDEMGEMQLKHQEKTQIESDLKRVDAEIVKYNEDATQIKQVIAAEPNLRQDLAEKQTQAEQAGEKRTELRELFQELAHEAKTVKSAIEEKESTKKKFDELGEEAPCPTCERPLGEHYGDKTSHLNDEIEALKQTLQGINKKGTDVRAQGEEAKKQHELHLKEVEQLRSRLVEQEKREEKLATLEAEKERRLAYKEEVKSRYTKVEHIVFDVAAYQALNEEIRKLSPMSDEIIKLGERIAEIPQLEMKIRDAKNHISIHEDAIKGFKRDQKSIGFDEEAYQQITQQTDEVYAKKTEAMEQKQTLSTTIAMENAKRSRIEEKINENEALKNEIKTDEGEMAEMEKLDKVFASYKIDKLAKLSPALSDIMSELMERITDGKYDRVELDDSYNIHVYKDNVKNPLEFYSGGEKKLAALCQRLAISNLLVSQTGQASFELLAMDEVFGAMDNARQDGLLEMLRNLNEVFPQILMVTHSDYVKDSFDHVLEIKTDSNGYSVASWETPWDENDVREMVETYNTSLESIEEDDGDEAV